MNKKDLTNAVAEQLRDSRAGAGRAVNAVLESIKGGLAADGQVQISGFGTFDVRERKGRQGRNPRTGESLWIAPSQTIHFHASSEWRAQIQQGPDTEPATAEPSAEAEAPAAEVVETSPESAAPAAETTEGFTSASAEAPLAAAETAPQGTAAPEDEGGVSSGD